MTDIAKKVKETLEDVKDKAMGIEHAAREKTEDYTSDIVRIPPESTNQRNQCHRPR